MVEQSNRGFSKTCYYELLDVDRKADTKTIEKVINSLSSCRFINYWIIGIQKGSFEVAP